MPQVEPVATWVFSIVTASWIVVQFLLRREANPAADLEIDVDFVGSSGRPVQPSLSRPWRRKPAKKNVQKFVAVPAQIVRHPPREEST